MKALEIDSSYALKFKALSEPTRLKMIPHLSEPHTVKQIADLLEIDHHALYHHMRVLEKAGIVTLVKTKEVGNIIEKYFQLTNNWVVMPGNSEKSLMLGFNPLLHQAIFSMLEDLSKSVQSGIETGLIHRVFLNIREKELDKKRDQIQVMVDEFLAKLLLVEDADGDQMISVNMLQFRMPASQVPDTTSSTPGKG
jgi:DNA-binding transcriptional ArsR family regulator